MSVTLDATLGGTTSNSFVDAVTAIGFASTRLNLTGWVHTGGTTLSDAEAQALIEATRYLSSLIYPGYRVSDTQALAWPRYMATDPDLAGARTYFPTDIIPQRVVYGTCELAITLLAAGTDDIAAADDTLGIMRRRVDVLETEYAAPSQRAQGLGRFPRVLRHIGPLLAVGAGQVRLTR